MDCESQPTLSQHHIMAISIWEISLCERALEGFDPLDNAEAGALVEFWGIVRRLEDRRPIKGINYEVHRPMAEHQMIVLAEKAARDFSLSGLVLRHRFGFVKVGEASLYLCTASSHRSGAFAASQWLIDELKQKVPIWKRPIFQDDRRERLAPSSSTGATQFS